MPSPLEATYDDRAHEVVIVKAAQVMVSEWAINLAFWCADTRAGSRGNVLYVFPAIAQLGDFVRARIDTVVEETPYLQERVRPTYGLQAETRTADNVGLKRVGSGFVYFRGSNATAGLLSVDADLVIYDEVDRLKPGTLAVGSKRLGSSLLGWQRYASTPTYPEVGIDALWLQSDRRRYHLRCERCGERQPLEFPTNVREDGETICRACREPMNRLMTGEWVAENRGAEIHGYQMTQLLSPRADIQDLAKQGYRILNRDETDPTAIQEFWNQRIGVPHSPEGGQLSRAEIAACRAEYSLDEWAPKGCSMGVDVGGKLHVVISAEGPDDRPRAAYIGTARDFDDLDALMRRFDVSRCVVDAEPEHHSARQFAERWSGRVWLCHYPNMAKWAHKEAAVWNAKERSVQAHRTITMDGAFSRIRERRIDLPREALTIPEFTEQMMAPIRIVERDAVGNPVARYSEGGRPDHYAHAFNYLCIALSHGGGARVRWL